MMFRRTSRSLLGRRALPLSVIAVSAVLLASCSSTPSEPSSPTTAATTGSGESPGDEPTEATPTGKVEIVWPGTSDPEKRLAEDFAAAMAEQDIEIEYNFLSWSDMLKQLAVRIQGKNPPGVTPLQDITDMVSLGGMLPLDDLIARDGIDLDKYLPGTLDYSTWTDGKLYDLPVTAQAFDLVVNEEMLNEAGYQIEDLETWADLEAAAAAMTKDGKYGFAYPLGVPRFAFRGALTAGYSNDLNIGSIQPEDEQKWKELLDHLAALEPYTPPAQSAWAYAEMFQAYSNGEVGIIPAGTFFTANVYAINPDIVGKSRQIAYPAGPSGTSQAPISNMGYGVFVDAEDPELAWYVVKQLAADEWIARIAAVVNTPAVTTVSMDDLRTAVEDVYPDAVEGHMQQLEDQITLIADHGVPLVAVKGQSAMEPEFQEVIINFLDGNVDRDTAYQQITERLGEIQAANQ